MGVVQGEPWWGTCDVIVGVPRCECHSGDAMMGCRGGGAVVGCHGRGAMGGVPWCGTMMGLQCKHCGKNEEASGHSQKLVF